MRKEKLRPATSWKLTRRSNRAMARHLSIVIAALGAFCAAMPHSALAYTDAEIATFLKRRFSCPVLTPDQVQSAQLRGAAGPVQVFLFGAEGCPSLPFTGTSFAAVAPGQGGITLLMPMPTLTAVESITVADGYVVGTSLDYAPTDPRCCPSRHVRQRWAISGSRLVRVP